MQESQIVEYLNEIVEKNDLENRAKESCLRYLKNWMLDEPDDFREYFDGEKPENIKMQFKMHSYTFDNNYLDYTYIDTTLFIFIDPQFMTANYSLITTLDGEIVDDYMDRV